VRWLDCYSLTAASFEYSRGQEARRLKTRVFCECLLSFRLVTVCRWDGSLTDKMKQAEIRKLSDARLVGQL
jgi:hypothetical protein